MAQNDREAYFYQQGTQEQRIFTGAEVLEALGSCLAATTGGITYIFSTFQGVNLNGFVAPEMFGVRVKYKALDLLKPLDIVILFSKGTGAYGVTQEQEKTMKMFREGSITSINRAIRAGLNEGNATSNYVE